MAIGSVFVLFSVVFCFGAGVWRHLYPGLRMANVGRHRLCHVRAHSIGAMSIGIKINGGEV
jgi:hypothetical protein